MIKSIIKRDGRVVLYDEGKIASAILKAMEAAQEGDASQAAAVANAVEAALEERCGAQPPQIEQIQDEVESQLMQMGFDNAAKKYILYRASRTRVREMNTRLMKVFDELTHADATASDMKRSNANIDGDTPMGTMLQYGRTGRAGSISMTLIFTPSPPPAAKSTCSSCSKAVSPRATVFCASPTTSRVIPPWHVSPSSPIRTTSTAARVS